jgi:hypothetical protein
LSTTCKILSNALLSRLTPYAQRFTGDHENGFRHKSNTDHTFCIRHMLETECQYNETACPQFLGFWKASDSVRREVLYNIVTEFGLPVKLVRLIKMCLNETYSGVRVGKHLSDMFPDKNS